MYRITGIKPNLKVHKYIVNLHNLIDFNSAPGTKNGSNLYFAYFRFYKRVFF